MYEYLYDGIYSTFGLAGYSTQEVNQLAQLYADGIEGLGPNSIRVGNLSWSYLDTLPDEGSHAVGDAYMYNGNYYIYLGSGLEGTPEPLTIVSVLMGIITLGVGGLLKRFK